MIIRKPVAVLQFAFLICITVLICVGVYYLVSRQTYIETMFSTEIGKKNGLKGKITELRLTEKSDKGDVWHILSKTAKVNAEYIELEDVIMDYFSIEHGPANLSSKTGVVQSKTHDASFSGNVILKSPKPFLLLTDRLDWDAEKRILSTDEDIRVETDESVIMGRGLVVYVDTQDFTILHSVRAVFN